MLELDDKQEIVKSLADFCWGWSGLRRCNGPVAESGLEPGELVAHAGPESAHRRIFNRLMETYFSRK